MKNSPAEALESGSEPPLRQLTPWSDDPGNVSAREQGETQPPASDAVVAVDPRPGPWPSAPGERGRPIGQAILRTFLVAGVVAGLAIVGVAVVSGDPSVASRSVGPFFIAAVAWLSLVKRKSPLAVLTATMFVIVATTLMVDTTMSYTNGMYGVVGLSLAAALHSDNRRGVLLSASVVVLVLAGIRHQRLHEPLSDVLISAIVALVVVGFAAQLMEWAKDEIIRRERRFENLFKNAPVATWEEDFSAVEAWLDTLRARGVKDLRSYLATRPEEIRRGASQINVVNVNAAAMRFLQADDRASLLGPLNVDHIVEETLDGLAEELIAVWEGRAQLTTGMTGKTAQGTAIEGYLLMAAPERADGIDWSKVVVAMVDVSEQRAAERRLQEIIKSKDEFVASVSHELRTPLTTVIGLAQEMRTNEQTIDEDERHEFLGMIADQAMDVANIVDDLLVAARADIGTITIKPTVVGLAAEVHSMLERMPITLTPRVQIAEGVVVRADAHRLRQILRNLISNADRYGGSTVDIAADVAGAKVVVEVSDDGLGVPEELAERVFEPYERAHVAVGVTASVGLGLTVSRQLARLMDGDLVYERADTRTVFRLTLPAGSTTPAEA